MSKKEKPVKDEMIEQIVKPKKRVQTAEGWKRNNPMNKQAAAKPTKTKAA